jgi:hypothetical protein
MPHNPNTTSSTSTQTSTDSSGDNNNPIPDHEIQAQPQSYTATTQTSQAVVNNQQTQTIPNNNNRNPTADEKSVHPTPARPAVGVAVLLTCSRVYPNSVLVGKRISSHGSNNGLGSYQLPGKLILFHQSLSH